VIDVATGAYTDNAFVINGAPGGGTLTTIPTSITFTGNQTTDCGGGTATFFVFGGSPPYTAASSSGRIGLTNTTSSSVPGQFTVSVAASVPPCATGTIVVTDPIGDSGSVDVTSAAGTGTPPTPATFTVAPTAITLGCGQSGSVTAVGGSGNYSTNSSSPNVTATVSGNTVTITRVTPSINPTNTATVSVTDGATIQSVTVTSQPTCP
jgi:hypothetical protein